MNNVKEVMGSLDVSEFRSQFFRGDYIYELLRKFNVSVEAKHEVLNALENIAESHWTGLAFLLATGHHYYQCDIIPEAPEFGFLSENYFLGSFLVTIDEDKLFDPQAIVFSNEPLASVDPYHLDLTDEVVDVISEDLGYDTDTTKEVILALSYICFSLVKENALFLLSQFPGESKQMLMETGHLTFYMELTHVANNYYRTTLLLGEV